MGKIISAPRPDRISSRNGNTAAALASILPADHQRAGKASINGSRVAFRRADRGIRPSIIKDIERTIRTLAAASDIAIALVEQYFEFCTAAYTVIRRGQIVAASRREMMNANAVRGYLTI
jgi:hypothetical protein